MSQELPVAIKEASQQYHRLVLLIGNAGKSALSSLPPEFARDEKKALINLNIELSQRLLDIPKKERPTKVNQIVQDIVGSPSVETVVLKNIELLFEPSLQLDPLQLLKSVSRNRTVVAFWPGELKKESLSYAEPGHREYKTYKRNETGAVFVELEATG